MNARSMSRRRILLAVVAVALVAVLAGSVVGSNMGFKLNYGIINAVNKLLRGSGLGISVDPANGNIPPVLVMGIAPSTQKSNMGFKLNLVEMPADGIVIEALGKTYKLDAVGAIGEEILVLTELP